MECASTRIWLGISDFQEEGIFLNVSRYSFQDVFVDSAIVGTNLKETRWGSNQPGGGVIENCVGTHRYYIEIWIKHTPVWSKTTLNTGGVGGAWAGPQTCEMVTFFLMSLALHKPILNNLK